MSSSSLMLVRRLLALVRTVLGCVLLQAVLAACCVAAARVWACLCRCKR